MKAISPVIATALMIGIAVVIGVVVSGYSTQFTLTQTGGQSVTCSLKSIYSVDKAEFSEITRLLTVKITNKGSQGIYGFEIEASSGTDIQTVTPESVTPAITSENPLGKESSAIITARLDRDIGKNLKVKDLYVKDVDALVEDKTLVEIIFEMTVKKRSHLFVVKDDRTLIGVVDRFTIIDKILFF